jgi:hypothetical protein
VTLRLASSASTTNRQTEPATTSKSVSTASVEVCYCLRIVGSGVGFVNSAAVHGSYRGTNSRAGDISIVFRYVGKFLL